MGKKYDFDKLFDGARDTVEYWQERHEIAHGEMLARDAEIEALKARIAKLEAERRCIPVDERLPDAGMPVYAYWADGGMGMARHNGEKWKLWESDGDTCLFDGPTHWQPLPKPPTESEVTND